jgi:hypothetical protein
VGLRWLVVVFVVTFAIYLAFVPRILLYSSPPTGDQPYYLMDVISLVQDHDLDVANNYAQHDEDRFYALAPRPPGFVGISAPYPLPPQLSKSAARPASEWYGYHLPGLALLLVPAWIVGSWFSLWWPATVVLMCVLGALVAINVFLLAHQQAPRLYISIPIWIALAFSNPLMTYAYLIFTELPVGLLLIYAFRRLAMGWSANSRLQFALIGLSIAYIPWLAWRCVVISACLAVLATIQWWRDRRLRDARDLDPAHATFVIAPVLVSAALLVSYNMFLFGRPVPELSVPELGETPFHFPWTGSKALTDTVTNAFALLFDRQMGLLTYAPVYLLAVAGMLAMWSSQRPGDRRLLGALLLVTVPYAGLIASFVFWNGIWNPPARYLTSLVPLLAAPLAALLFSGSRIVRLTFDVVAVPGILLALAMLADARRLWPSAPVYGWLADGGDLPFRIDIRSWLPAFSPVDELGLPLNTARLIVASSAIVFVCWLAMQKKFSRGAVRRSAAGWLAAGCLLGAGWHLTSAEYLKPQTILTEQRRWSLPGDLQETRGLAYLNGTLYITAFRSGKLVALDAATGDTRTILSSPVSATGQPVDRPGDVLADPDGFLFVLDNREGSGSVLVLQPDGGTLRQIPLQGSSGVAMGLRLAADRSWQVADMVGRRILAYPADGGQPLFGRGGLQGGFNNISGIALAADGSVYAAESSAHRVQHLGPDGQPLDAWDLDCEPQYVALSSDWLDVTCGSTLLSIFVGPGGSYVQRTRIVGGPPGLHLNNPRGLTYAPDGTLYVVDNQTLIQYTVQHRK